MQICMHRRLQPSQHMNQITIACNLQPVAKISFLYLKGIVTFFFKFLYVSDYNVYINIYFMYYIFLVLSDL